MNQFQNSPEERFFKQNAWPSWIPRLLAAALGIILLAAGLSKATDMALFVRQIRDYGIISNFLLLNLSAWGLIVLESTLGTGLLVFYRPRLFLLLTALLLLIFSGTSTWALLSGSMEDCGCFGAWLKRTPGEALIETLILLATALVAWVGQRNRFISKARPKVYIVAVGCLVGLIMPLFFGSPILRLGQSPWETVELELRNLKPQGLEDLDLNKGVHLIIIMDTECAHCRDEIEELGLSQEKSDLPPLIGLSPNEEIQIKNFVEEYQPPFPIGRISEDSFWRLLGNGDIPRSILFENRHVTGVWDKDIPDKVTIEAALTG